HGLGGGLAELHLFHAAEHDLARLRHGFLRCGFVASLERMTGTRDGAIERAEKYFDTGGFLADLQRRVAIPTTSQEEGSMPALQQYVSGEMTESLQKLGYECTVQPNPRAEYGPFLIARRVEDPAKPTVLTYGHGDVIRGQ